MFRRKLEAKEKEDEQVARVKQAALGLLSENEGGKVGQVSFTGKKVNTHSLTHSLNARDANRPTISFQ